MISVGTRVLMEDLTDGRESVLAAAQVESLDDRGWWLRFLDEAPLGALSPGDPARLSASIPGSLMRAETTVFDRDGDRVGVLAPSRLDQHSRRLHARVQVDADARWDARVRNGSARVVDLSPGGMCLTGADRLGTGDPIIVDLQFDDTNPTLRVSGLVVGMSKGDHGEKRAHVAFTHLDDVTSERLHQLCAS
jgi:PilZ domain